MPISPLCAVLFLCLCLSIGLNVRQFTRLERVPKEKYRIFRTGVTCGAAGFENRIQNDEIGNASPLFGFEYLHNVALAVVDEDSTWSAYKDALQVQEMYDVVPEKLWLRRGPGAELDAHILARMELQMREKQNRPPGADTEGAG